MTDFDAGTDPKFLIVSDGCPTVPCWAETKLSGTVLEFHAVRFSTGSTIYLYSQILLCLSTEDCSQTGCSTCNGANDPSGRRRRATKVLLWLQVLNSSNMHPFLHLILCHKS